MIEAGAVRVTQELQDLKVLLSREGERKRAIFVPDQETKSECIGYC